MKFLLALSALFVLVVLANATPYGPYNAFTGDFGGPTAFGGSFGSSFGAPFGGSAAALTRDNRQNRGNQGPVVFPMSPADAPVESSGVVIGASGYGFVPPGQQSFNGGFRRSYF